MSSLDTFVRTTLPAAIRVETGRGGLPRLAIATRHGHAEIYFHGAHITSWHPATSASPVIWLSRESLFTANKAIRGGIPICFPWFGAHASDPTAPAHGFARLRQWSLIDARDELDQNDEILSMTFELTSEDDLSPFWPHAFRATYRVAMGPGLSLALQIQNIGPTPFTFEEALHTYFAVGDIHNVTLTGLERTTYLNKVTGFSRVQQDNEPIRFTGETDRVYLNTKATCTLHDPGTRRTIAIRKTGSDSTVVWNPWIDKARAMADFGDDEWPEMLCVETCNVNVHACRLDAGETHIMTASIDASQTVS